MTTNFTSEAIQGKMKKGSVLVLEGWWAAHTDYLRSGAKSIRAYSHVAENEKGAIHKAKTIADYIKLVERAKEDGHKPSSFPTLTHLVATYYKSQTKEAKTASRGVRVTAATFTQAANKAGLTPAQRKVMRKEMGL